MLSNREIYLIMIDHSFLIVTFDNQPSFIAFNISFHILLYFITHWTPIAFLPFGSVVSSHVLLFLVALISSSMASFHLLSWAASSKPTSSQSKNRQKSVGLFSFSITSYSSESVLVFFKCQQIAYGNLPHYRKTLKQLESSGYTKKRKMKRSY